MKMSTRHTVKVWLCDSVSIATVARSESHVNDSADGLDDSDDEPSSWLRWKPVVECDTWSKERLAEQTI